MSRVLVLGGGIMGLGCARELRGLGLEVTVLERAGRFGDEASRASAGMIGPQSEAMEDDAYFAATLASRDLWKDYAAGLHSETGIEFGFRPEGTIHLAFGAAYERRLEAKYLWQKHKAGHVVRWEGEELRSRFPFLHPRVSCAYFADGDYVIDNELAMDALEAACRKRGVSLVLNAEAGDLRREEGLWRVDAAGKTYEAESVLVAAGAWASGLWKGLPKTHPVRGQMLSFRVPKELMPSVPVHAEFVYLVPRPDGRLLVGATVETVGFDKKMTGEGIEYLLQNAFETMPDLRNCEVDRLWCGLRPGASDGWPTLGATDQPGLFAAIGHFRRGILFLPLTALALGKALRGEPLPEAARAFSFERHGAHAKS